ncbi:MAG: hypothetical protein CLLPBCKN_000760 [Chroococcidiopsis cubana SAG 39.79]|jgi:hypothetical protein|uniref:Uncharacterized protein n=1 Tax=Chroococcidiopsis cubana SAG 39.79 TaxID=388085 RepID=A0AB37UDQ8_9CYAN|nr:MULTISPECIES: CTB family bacteriocin [Chroococcidiopsis]PSB47405.1 hypothetical protein C7B80_09445 [Cyanosarcina cf. burmensis CCALA 770]MDZ4871372.1 hypothetical protein [Chroococcidiopsis cubana SAG 39.79]PSB60650.1 hypothetical protein C7B79_24970 [Chroococcidiopsis cubana CCALA 043]RUT04921.1 hypothetical protein DSM107010_56670 [Chroococcidiopsis cubana SAG 39.79]URD48106.1 CTB family bacteriocin [Chroococcidiopsis sp. CCNUC1]
MIANNIKSELFVELSEDQQQLVAGGGSSGDVLKDKLATHFKTDETITNLEVAQESTPKGSTNLQSFKHDTLNVNTAAYKDFFAKLS